MPVIINLLRKSMLFLALRRFCFDSIYEIFDAVDGQCFLKGLVISRKSSSSNCVTDKSDKNEPVELISLQFRSSVYLFDRDLRLWDEIFKEANVSRTSVFSSRSVCKKSHTVESFSSCKQIFTCSLGFIYLRC